MTTCTCSAKVPCGRSDGMQVYYELTAARDKMNTGDSGIISPYALIVAL